MSTTTSTTRRARRARATPSRPTSDPPADRETGGSDAVPGGSDALPGGTDELPGGSNALPGGPPAARDSSAPRRRRPPPSRLQHGALAGRHGPEGLVWLGRAPEAHATILYRVVRAIVRVLLFGAFRFRISTSGQEHLPQSSGYLLVAAAHRGWMDPFVAMHALPLEPRAWFLGSAPSTIGSRSREVLARRIGGLLPVWRGGLGIDVHVDAARAVVAGGGVFVQMPEGTVSGPPGRIGPFRLGAALIALRTGAPVVPLAIAGTEELYVGRRMASRVLPVTSARELAGLDADEPLPSAGSRAELDLARRVTAGLEEVIGPVVEELHPSTVDPPSRRRLLRDRLTWLLLARGRVDRDTGGDAAPGSGG